MHPITSKYGEKNRRGESTILFLLTILSVLLLIYLSMLLIKREIGYQIRLIKKNECLQESITSHINYIDQIDKANQVIITSNIINLIPALKVTAQSIIKLVKMIQEFSYTMYLLNLSINKNCLISEIKDFLGPTPYERIGIKFKRNKFGQVIIKEKDYSLSMCFKILKIKATVKFPSPQFKVKKKVNAKKVLLCN